MSSVHDLQLVVPQDGLVNLRELGIPAGAQIQLKSCRRIVWT